MYNLPRARALGSLLALATALSLTACASPTPSADPAADHRPLVVAGLYPFQFLAEEIGGDRVDVTNLTPPGAEPHDLELTARQVETVGQADLVIYLSNLQPAVDEAVAQAAPPHLIDVASLVELLSAAAVDPPQDAGEHQLDTSEDDATDADEHDEADADEHDEADADEHADEHAHTTGGFDTHIWLDPERFATVATAIEQALASIAPDHAAFFADRAEDLQERLTDLDQAYVSGLADCQREVFITAHTAFGYLAHRYGLIQVGIAGLTPDAEPSPARITQIHRIAQANGVTTIFFETLVSPALAEAIASDLNLKTAVLDPIEGLSDQSAASDYFGLMAANLQALREANGCS